MPIVYLEISNLLIKVWAITIYFNASSYYVYSLFSLMLHTEFQNILLLSVIGAEEVKWKPFWITICCEMWLQWKNFSHPLLYIIVVQENSDGASKTYRKKVHLLEGILVFNPAIL